MFRTWHLMGATKDVILVHGRGPAPEAIGGRLAPDTPESPQRDREARTLPEGAEPLTPDLASWHLAAWLDDDSARATFREIADHLGSFRGSPAHPDSNEVLAGLLRRAFFNGTLRAFFWKPAKLGGNQGKPDKPPAPPPAPKRQVNPIIKPASIVVVVVKTAKDPKTGTTGPYTHPKRRAVTLTTDIAFDGTGTFTCDKQNLVKFFSAAKGGVEITFDGKDNVFKPGASPAWAKGATLSGGGVTVFAEGQKPSGGMDDITLRLSLSGGSKPTGPDDKATATSVEVTLDIFQPPAAAGAAPAPLSQDDKIFVGRNVLVQDAKNHFDRAQLVIRPIKPASFKGDLVLHAKNGDVTVFRDEKPKAGEKALLPYTIATDKIGAGDKLWVQGKAASSDMRATGFTLGIKGIEDEGDKVAATAVQITLDLCKSRTTKAADPAPLSADDKVKVGRFVHEQDAKNHHGRALLVVRKVKPDKFDGTLVLRATGAHTALFPNEQPTGGEAVIAVPHEIDYTKEKNEDKKFWVQGKTVSAALRDAGYFLHMKGDLSTNADTVLLTVCKFSHIKADIPSTPAHTNRLGNSPVNRHSYERVGNPDDFDEDDTANPPLVLLERSVVAADAINLSVQIAPAGVPVSWSVQRDTRPPPKGDHANVIALSPRPIPHVDPNAGDRTKATLVADAIGSFHVRPFVDNNGNGKFDAAVDLEPFIIMNVVFVAVRLHANHTSAPGRLIGVAMGAGGIGVGQEGTPAGTLAPNNVAFNVAAPAKAGIHMDVEVDFMGGGGDGKRGVDCVFGGWINNMPGPGNVVATFQDNTVAPPTVHHTRRVFASNTGHGPGHAFVTRAPPAHSDAPPNIVAPPVLDTGKAPGGQGGDDACLRHSRMRTPGTDLNPGQRIHIEAVDSPGDGASATHPGNPNAQLVNYHYDLTFRAWLVFWTNAAKNSGATGDPADRLYVVLGWVDWFRSGEWNINPANGALTIVTPPSTRPRWTAASPPVRAVDTAIEVRVPRALALYELDAQG